MSNVDRIRPDITQIEIPDQLRGLKGWLVWRYEQREGEPKPRKVPHYVGGGRRGAHGTQDDRNRLTTADAAIAFAARKGFDGIGLAMLADWGMIALDFDRAVNSGGVLPEVNALVSHTYAEFSPSGEGVRAFVMGVCPNKKSFDPPFGFETFHSSGFVTFTGNRLPSCDILGNHNTVAPITDALRELISRRLLAGRDPRERPAQSGERIGYSNEQLAAMLEGLDPDESYERWYQAGMALHHETDGEGFDIWDDWSSNGSLYPGRDELQRKWDGFGRNGQQPTTIRTLLKWAGQAGSSVGGPVASPDDFEVVEETPEEVAERQQREERFDFLGLDQIIARSPVGWIIKGIIPRAALAVIYGPSGAGKSFIMLDLAMAIARGEPWRGHKVTQGRVGYICAEGAGGFRNRIKAYALHHRLDVSQIPLRVMETAPNFLQADDVKAVARAIQRMEGAAVIFVDTFAKVTPGANENAGEDMGKAIDNCRRIAEATGALVVLVHHTGKDVDRGARGWSGIRAAADFEAEVCHDQATAKRWLQITKQKDGDDTGRWGFRLESVVTDIDEDGDAVTSCVIVEDDAPTTSRAGRAKAEKMSPWEKTVVETFSELQVGGDVLFTELVLRAAERRPEGGSFRDRKKNVAKVIRKMATGPKAVFILGDDYVTEVQ